MMENLTDDIYEAARKVIQEVSINVLTVNCSLNCFCFNMVMRAENHCCLLSFPKLQYFLDNSVHRGG